MADLDVVWTINAPKTTVTKQTGPTGTVRLPMNATENTVQVTATVIINAHRIRRQTNSRETMSAAKIDSSASFQL